MIVLLVYRPEAASTGSADEPHGTVPFEGIEVYGSYYEMESVEVAELAVKLKVENPGWHIQIDSGVKNYIGLRKW